MGSKQTPAVEHGTPVSATLIGAPRRVSLPRGAFRPMDFKCFEDPSLTTSPPFNNSAGLY